MFTLYAKLTAVLICLFGLIGCATAPTSTQIQPTITTDNSTITFSNRPWSISSQDERIERHLIEIENGDDMAQLINEKQSLRLAIEKSLTTAWLNNKLNIEQMSNDRLEIKLVKSLATVTESTFGYEVSSEMQIKIKLSHQGNSFTKLFTESKQWDKGFSVNIEDITEHLDSQLSSLLTRIVEDQELNNELQNLNNL
ncbi:YajG family lipoprotein [Psychromonas aquatilis]|uniref:YajG family lipoprotein n=1 Tax=Psychromonas aquatilis TaxID=2005072 RepID=A0ABU9GQ94_9GAMM